jgi:hypothetical protein
MAQSFKKVGLAALKLICKTGTFKKIWGPIVVIQQVVIFRKEEIEFSEPIYPREFEQLGHTTHYEFYGITSGTFGIGIVPKQKGKIDLLSSLATYLREKHGYNISLDEMREKISHLIVYIEKIEQNVVHRELQILYISDSTISVLCKKINE